MGTWDESNSDPISDMKAAMKHIKGHIGYKPPDPFSEHCLHLLEKIIVKEVIRNDNAKESYTRVSERAEDAKQGSGKKQETE